MFVSILPFAVPVLSVLFCCACPECVTVLPLNHFNHPIKPLLPFDDEGSSQDQTGIPFHFSDYLTLIDWTGRAIRGDKRSAITQTLPPILERLSIAKDKWLANSLEFEANYPRQFQKRRRKVA